jgi:ribosomal protein L37AE/L43A
VNWLNFIDKVYIDFCIEEKENSPNGLKVLEYDKFFREESIKRNLHMPKFLRQTPIERLDARTERYTLSKTTEKAVCPSCGSNDTVSNGKFRILCNACGKQCQKSKVKQWITITREEDEESF